MNAMTPVPMRVAAIQMTSGASVDENLRAATPLVVLMRSAGWTDVRPFHGAAILPVRELPEYLVARGHVLSPAAVGSLYAGLRLALAA